MGTVPESYSTSTLTPQVHFKTYLDAHLAYLHAEREQLFPVLREYLTDAEQKALLQMLPDGAQANLSRLWEDYPELYAEFRAASSLFS